MTPKECTRYQNTFSACIEPCHACQAQLYVHLRNQKSKKTRGYNTHLFHPIPVGGHRILHVGLDDGRSQTCQISAESVEGLQSPRELKMTLLIWRIALTTMYALTCSTVINKGAAISQWLRC